MTNTVFVDVDNTLLDFGAGAQESMTRGLAECGIVCTPEMVETFHRINDGLWLEVEKGSMTRSELYAVRFERIFSALGLPLDAPAFETRFHGFLCSCAVPFDGAEALLRYLSGKYTVCAASNAAQEQQHTRLARAGLLPYIREIFTSELLGAEKPSRAFFDACFARLPDAKPETTVMIGDSLSADIGGAQDCGLKTVWFNPHGKTAPEALRPDFTVKTLAEICTIL